MSLRLDDWECVDCGEVREELTEKNGPKSTQLACVICEEKTDHRRLMSAPARYLGKRLRQYYAPTIYGGKYDTQGYVPTPKLPDLPGADKADREYTKAIEALGDKATPETIQQVTRGCGKDAPTLADYREHHRKPEWQEAKKERAAIIKQNQEKRQRAAAGVPVREKPLAGDAKELHR